MSGRPAGGATWSIRSRWAGWSTIRAMAAASCGSVASSAIAARSTVGYATSTSSRHTGCDQPDRLGQGVRHHAVPAGPGQHPFEQGAAAHRLAGDPERFAAGAGRQRGGVGVEGGQVDHGERRLEVRGGAVEASLQIGAFGDHASNDIAFERQCETPSCMRHSVRWVSRAESAPLDVCTSAPGSDAREVRPSTHAKRARRRPACQPGRPVRHRGAALRAADPAVPAALAGARASPRSATGSACWPPRSSRRPGHRQRRQGRARSAARSPSGCCRRWCSGPIAGVMADRFDRRYTMVICDLHPVRLSTARSRSCRSSATPAGSRSPGRPSPPSSARRSR